jgi:hypothetical protein
MGSPACPFDLVALWIRHREYSRRGWGSALENVMRLPLHATVLFLTACALLACGSAPTAPSLNVSGTWQGTIESEGPGTIRLQIAQNGSNITGTVLLSQDGIDNVPGTVVGTLDDASVPASLPFTVTYTYGFNCHGSFSGTMTLTSSEMHGSYSGENCVRPFTGTLQATRQ